MSRILVIGDLMVDRYRFFKPLRSDPANDVALVVECEKQVDVDGGAGNLVRNLKTLCENDVHFWYAGETYPTKIRYYVEDRFILREDREDVIEHDASIIDEFVASIESGDFVIISDYHKGTIEYDDIVRIIKKCQELDNVTTFADTNHIYPEHENVDWLKVNLKTAKGGYDYNRANNQYVNKNKKDIAKDISKKNNSNVVVTQGEEGCVAYLRDTKTNIVFTKDKNENCIDAIGAGDTFLAGFVSYLIKHDNADLPALVYADVVAHLSTQQLGTIDSVTAKSANDEYENVKTSIEETKDTLYVHRSIIND